MLCITRAQDRSVSLINKGQTPNGPLVSILDYLHP